MSKNRLNTASKVKVGDTEQTLKSWAFNRSVSTGHQVRKSGQLNSATLITKGNAPIPEDHQEAPSVPEVPASESVVATPTMSVAEQNYQNLQNQIAEIQKDPVKASYLYKLLTAEGKDAPIIDENLTTGQKIARQALRYPVPGLLLQDLVNATAGKDSALSAGVSHFNEQLPFGFGDEIQGGIDTAANLITGNLGDRSLVDDYRLNRDLRRENLARQAEAHPTASSIGGFAGSLPAALLLRGRSPTSSILGGAAMGGAYGLGNSTGDHPLEDMAAGAAIGGLLMGGAEGAKGLTRLFNPKTLDAIAAHNRIAGGGDPRSAPLLNIPREGELPAAIRGFLRAKEKGLLSVDGPYVTNKKYSALPDKEIFSDPIEALKKTKAGERIRQLFSRESDIDYDQHRTDLGNLLSQGRAEKLEMLSPIAKEKIPLSSLFGANPTATGLRTINAIKGIEHQVKTYGTPLSTEEAMSLQSLKKNFLKEYVTGAEAEEISRNLGILTRNSLGKQLPEGSPQALLRDSKIRIDDELGKALDERSPGSGKLYKSKNQELYELSEYLDSVKEGQAKYLKKYGASDEFTQSPFERVILSKDGKVDLGELAGKGIGIGAQLAGKSLGMIGATGKALTPWATQLFTSYNASKGSVTDERDIELYKHYIDTSNSLSPKEKAQLKALANSKGTIDLSVVPKDIAEESKEKTDQEQIESVYSSPSNYRSFGAVPMGVAPLMVTTTSPESILPLQQKDFSPFDSNLPGMDQETDKLDDVLNHLPPGTSSSNRSLGTAISSNSMINPEGGWM